ncbi:MAG TPA: PHP domain-containing protein [Candidatus Saccharimonadales bacterium]
MIAIDLHTHSEGSPDGGLRLRDYARMLASGTLQAIAITDHDDILFAQSVQESLGDQIIVGEEISTREGELIGLFLNERIAPGLSARETVETIKAQNGLVYVPHPFETVRKGISKQTLDGIAKLVDIVEVHNGRAIFQNRGSLAQKWAEENHKATAASSDAHGRRGWGKTFSVITEMPRQSTLVELLKSAELSRGTVGLRGALYPKQNRLKRRHS